MPSDSILKSPVLFLCVLVSIGFSPSGFLTDQKKYSRVQEAYLEKENFLTQNLQAHHLRLDNFQVLFTAYKNEKELDIFVKARNEKKYTKLSTYTICASSGHLGPKRKIGDYQVPEGFYYLEKFNPVSNYYLSLGINYPNKSDQIKSAGINPGSEIYIHGECVTIGCIPMTNDKIKEIYLYAIQAKNNGQQKIPVYIFPFRFTEKNWNTFSDTYNTDPTLLSFWSQLKTGYDMFLEKSEELIVNVDKEGNYSFN